MSDKVPTQNSENDIAPRLGIRIVIAAAVVAVVAAYSAAVLSGWIKGDNRIDGVHFALIVLAIIIVIGLIQPRTFDRLKRVKLSGFELEILERVRDKQAEQDDQLEDIRLMLSLLLPATERDHLFNLESGNTSYKGNHAVRTELRRLRSMHLLQMKQGKNISELKDEGIWDIGTFVELTPMGRRWIKRVREVEKVPNPGHEASPAATV
jgi:hypothetical protein